MAAAEHPGHAPLQLPRAGGAEASAGPVKLHLDKKAAHVVPTGRNPAWCWFGLSNAAAVLIFAASCASLLKTLPEAAAASAGGGRLALTPLTVASLAGAVGSLVYFLAFFGVAFMSAGLASAEAEAAAAAKASASGAASSAAPSAPVVVPSSPNPEHDVDVVILGAGTAGAALAAALGRAGKRVAVIEREYSQYDRIVGELLQPGGVRALERMGLGHAAKSAALDCVNVEGYVCMRPGAPACEDLILTYPNRDPSSLPEHFGVLGADAAAGGNAVKRHADGATSGVAGSPGAAAADALGDAAPRGRSFHNSRFVHELRLGAAAYPTVTLHAGIVKRLVYRKELAAVAEKRTGARPAPAFRGFAADGHTALKHTRETLEAAGYTVGPNGEALPGPGAAPIPAGAPSSTGEPDDVIGLAWVDETGVERVTTAALTVCADGMWSAFRKHLHSEEMEPSSTFCGLLLHHPAQRPPLPYPNRGHVIMADPNPVLLYQISATETRVLVDVPGKAPQGEELVRYFTEVVAPQLPVEARPAFLEAVATQKATCMQNKRLPARPTQKRGACLLGDAWNMRHPLTGGGMTVALKDAELLANTLARLDLGAASPEALHAALASFQAARGRHASTINVLSTALHRVFTTPPGDASGSRAALRRACLDYLAMGGPFSAGPLGLLSGLTPRPEVLVTHFFAVAAHAMKQAVLPLPTPSRLSQAHSLLRIACMIILPLLEAEDSTFLASKPVLALTNLLFPWREAAEALVE